MSFHKLGIGTRNPTKSLDVSGSMQISNSLDVSGNVIIESDLIVRGTPTAPTADTGTNSTQIATTAFVANAVSGFSTDANISSKADFTYVDASLNLKANIASPTFTGTPTAPTAASSTNTMQIATTAFVVTATSTKADTTSVNNSLSLKANLASPTFTGTVSGITKTMVGLGLVDNTSDVDKQVSTPQQNALNLKANLASPTFTGTVGGITKSMVGLGLVDNTSDVDKQVSTPQQNALNLKANLASPALTGTPTAPTATSGTNTGQIATTAYVDTAVSNLVSSAPDTLNTLNELAAALGDDANFSTTITNSIATKAPINNPTFTGTVGGIDKSMVGLDNVDNTSDQNKIVSTPQQNALNLKANISTVDASLNLKANLASPTFTGTVGGITKSMVGLANVDNTSDTNKPVSTAQQTALDLKANLASPALTGTPSAPTAASGTNTGQIATTAYVDTAVSNLVSSAPDTLNTLNELAAALGDDANFSTTITNSIATKAPINNPTFTGTVGGIDKSMVGLNLVDNTSDQNKIVSTPQQNALNLKADLESPALTGTPTAPTATSGTNTTQIATTAFVTTALSGVGGGSDLTQDISVNSLTVGRGSGNVDTNSTFGRLALASNTTGYYNTAFGRSALFVNTTGNYNVAVGTLALYANTTGSQSVATGNNALTSNTTGGSNVAIGDNALRSNTTGDGNIAIGRNTGWNNTTASYNTFIGMGTDLNSSGATWTNSTALGYGALITASNQIMLGRSSETVVVPGAMTISGVATAPTATSGTNTTQIATTAFVADAVSGVGGGPDLTQDITVNSLTVGKGSGNIGSNTAFGFEALKANTTGAYNTASGYQSLKSNTTGSENVATGYYALKSNTTGVQNTANGYQALVSNTTGAYNTANGSNALYSNTTGNYNVANGTEALVCNTTGYYNTANGTYTLLFNSEGSFNVASGFQALFSNTTGSFNVATGRNAGYNNTTASNNTFIGYSTNISPTTATWTESTALGYGALITASNQVVLGRASETVVVPGAMTISGVATAPTATSGDNSTQIANTAFVTTALSSVGGGPDLTQDISVNSLTVGKGSGNIGSNTAFGINALVANTTGENTVAIGENALQNNTTGHRNVANGRLALNQNTEGNNNVANGFGALYTNTTGNFNVANGSLVLYSNTTGKENTANGYQSLYANTTGNYNVANGYQALYKNTTGGTNTANGYQALYYNTTGTDNTANGCQALRYNTTGYNNSANGFQALYSNTTGYSNSANGYHALYSNTTGYNNTANGYYALYSNTTSNHNTANGVQALSSNTTGNENVATGYYSGYSNTGGSYNTFLGTWAHTNNGNHNYSTALGYGALITASNQVVLGRATETVVVPGAMTISGIATVPTATSGDNSTQIANTAFVTTALSGVGGGVDLTSAQTITGIKSFTNGITLGTSLIQSTVTNLLTQLGSNINGAAMYEQFGWSVSLNSDGTFVAISAPGSTSYTGHVRVYQRDTDAPIGWTQVGSNIVGEAASDNSGKSVSISADGSIVAIGATGNDGNGSVSGHGRVYQRDTNAPIGWARLGGDIDGEATQNYSGISMSLSANGRIVAIGAYYNDGTRGHVRVYQYDDTKTTADTNQSSSTFGPIGWNRLGQDIDGEATGDESGISVSLSSDGLTVAIGANKNDGTTGTSTDNRGHVRVYQYDNTKNAADTDQSSPTFGPVGWNRLGQDIDGEAENDQSGWSVSLSSDGTIVAIGAKSNNNGTGHVRVYQYSGGSWYKLGDDIDGNVSGDQFGISVSLSSDGSAIAIGAYASNTSTGYARVYQLPSTTTSLVLSDVSLNGIPTAPTAASGDNSTQIANTAFVTTALSGAGGGPDLTQDISVNSLTVGKGSGNISNNTAFGVNALKSNTTGTQNVANGYHALFSNTTGNYNTATGYLALQSNTTGSYNTANGRFALQSNTTGNNNTANGFAVLMSNSAGLENTAYGGYSLLFNTTGNYNTANGSNALLNNTSGGLNTSIGYQAGYDNTTASNNTFIGASTNISPTSATWTNSTALGYGATITASNQIVLGRASETVVVPGDMTISGVATAPTAASGTNTTQIATTAFVATAVSGAGGGVDLTSDQTITGMKTFTNGITVGTDASINVEIQYITETYPSISTGNGYDDAGAVSMSSDGSVIIVGCTGFHPSYGRDGRATLFKRTNNIYSYASTFNGVTDNGKFGESVAITRNGSYIAIGSPGAGAGYVEVYQTVSYSKIGSTIYGVTSGDYFGQSVSINDNGTIVAIGAPYRASGGTLRGEVKVYQYSGGSWSQYGGYISGGANYDYFGYSVSLSSDGSILAVGAYGNNSSTGQVKVYQYTSNWVQYGSTITGDATSNYFGYSVSLSADGSTLAIGAYGNNSSTGQVKVYQYSSGWSQLGSSITGASSSSFGTSVALTLYSSVITVAIGSLSGSDKLKTYKYIDSTWTNTHSGDRTTGKYVAISADGEYIAHASGSNAYFYKMTTVKPLKFDSLSVENINFLELRRINQSVAIGYDSLKSNTSGSFNTAIGYDSLKSNTSTSYNTAVGYQTLKNNTSSFNTAVGYNALQNNTSGYNNTAVGYNALQPNTTGSRNTAFGFALRLNTSGSDNTAIGYDAGFYNGTNSQNTFVGSTTGFTGWVYYTNSTALGYGATITASNQIVLGNSSISSLNCQVQTISSLSDIRDKKNIQPLTNGIAFVDKLNPVKFDWNMRDGGKVDIPEMGFIAQELQQVQEETEITVPGLVSDNNPDRLEASYGTLLPILVKAIQELSAKLTTSETKNTELEAKNATLQSQLDNIMAILNNNNLL